MKVSIIGLDIAKSSFQTHGVDANGTCIFKRSVVAVKFLLLLKNLHPVTLSWKPVDQHITGHG